MADKTHLGARPNVRLSGWKEIASHLGRGVRTVQRWEDDYGLPVRRLGFGKGETVFAFSDEVDDWFVTSQADSARADSAGGAADPIEGTESSEEGERDDAPASTGNGTQLIPRRRRWRGWALAVAIVGAVVVGVVGYYFATRVWVRPLGTPGATATRAGHVSAEPASVHVDFDAVVALDSNGSEIWRHRFGFQLSMHEYGPGVPDAGSRLGIADIDGDAHREVLIITWPQQLSGEHQPTLFVFGRDGSLRWSYSMDARAVVQYGSEQFTGPWTVAGWFMTAAPEDQARRALWVASHHGVMFPATLQRLNPMTGVPLTSYWSDGYILSVNLATVGGRQRLLVGTCNNETRGAALAVLDAGRPNGAAPSQLSKYRCANCPAGEPLEFIVFPKPARFASMDVSSCAFKINQEAGGFTIGVRHAIVRGDVFGDVYYRLDEHFQAQSVDVGDGYKLAYEALVRQRIIPAFTAANGAGPTSEFPPILRWSGGGYVPVGKSTSRAASAR